MKRELVITIELPEGASDTEVVNALRDLMLAASAVHQAGGGSGLKLEDVRVYEPVKEPRP